MYLFNDKFQLYGNKKAGWHFAPYFAVIVKVYCNFYLYEIIYVCCFMRIKE